MRPNITIVEHVYYTSKMGPPITASSRYTANCKSEETPSVQPMVVGEAWVPVPLGWLSHVGCVHIENQEGKHFDRIPTPEERQLISQRIVDVAFTEPVDLSQLTMHDPEPSPPEPRVYVPPFGGSARFYTEHAKVLHLRCRSGDARVLVTLFPE